MEYCIVDAAEEYLDGLERLEQACFSCPWTREQLRHYFRDEQHELLAAIDGRGTVCGYTGMMIVLDEGYISNVAVAKDCRRKGIADELIRGMLDRAAMRGLAFVSLEVRESNTPAISLYEKHGFREVGRRKNYYEQPKENAILMTKFFSEAPA